MIFKIYFHFYYNWHYVKKKRWLENICRKTRFITKHKLLQYFQEIESENFNWNFPSNSVSKQHLTLKITAVIIRLYSHTCFVLFDFYEMYGSARSSSHINCYEKLEKLENSLNISDYLGLLASMLHKNGRFIFQYLNIFISLNFSMVFFFLLVYFNNNCLSLT